MSQPTPDVTLSFFQRLPLAFGAFFSTLGNPEFASGVLALKNGPATQTGTTDTQVPLHHPH